MQSAESHFHTTRHVESMETGAVLSKAAHASFCDLVAWFVLTAKTDVIVCICQISRTQASSKIFRIFYSSSDGEHNRFMVVSQYTASTREICFTNEVDLAIL